MAPTNKRFAFSEIKIPGLKMTTSLMKWQRIGEDNMPIQTVYIKRQYNPDGGDPLDGYRLPYIMTALNVETAFTLESRISGPSDSRIKSPAKLLAFIKEQLGLKKEFETAEYNEIMEKISEFRIASRK